MRPASSLLQVALCLSSVAPLVSAFPGWNDYVPHRDTLIVRANKDSPAPGASASDSSPAPTQPPSGTSSDNSSPSDSGSDSATPTGSKTTPKGGKPTDKSSSGKDSSSDGSSSGDSSSGDNSSGDTTATDDESSDASPTHVTFNNLDPAGGAVMQTPKINQLGAPLYKIGDIITWGWNYTSLQGTPTAIDVLVTCTPLSSTWTLTQNMTFETSVAFFWDTAEQENDIDKPLLTNNYKLIVKDSDRGINDRPESGYLNALGFTFNLYAKQSYVPFPDFKCLDCGSGAGGAFDVNAVRLALTMCIITVLSFTWFVAGLGLQ